MSALERLARELRAERGLLAGALTGATGEDPYGSRAASGPRAAAAPDDYALVLAAVREGYLLHYGEGRVVRPDDPDLALLGGDQLYAIGLARLAALGDLDAVTALADLISLCAQAHADGDGEGGDPATAAALADAAWEAAAVAIGRGATPELLAARERARAGEVDAAARLRDAAMVRNNP